MYRNVSDFCNFPVFCNFTCIYGNSCCFFSVLSFLHISTKHKSVLLCWSFLLMPQKTVWNDLKGFFWTYDPAALKNTVSTQNPLFKRKKKQNKKNMALLSRWSCSVSPTQVALVLKITFANTVSVYVFVCMMHGIYPTSILKSLIRTATMTIFTIYWYNGYFFEQPANSLPLTANYWKHIKHFIKTRFMYYFDDYWFIYNLVSKKERARCVKRNFRRQMIKK